MSYRHKTFEQRLTEFYGCPLDQIPRMEQEEVYWGVECGAEKLPTEDLEYYRELIAEMRI